MKTVYYTFYRGVNAGSWTVKYWTKHDESNAISYVAVSIDENRIRYHVQATTGHKHVDLVYVKPEGK
jgi:hypothetical protein